MATYSSSEIKSNCDTLKNDMLEQNNDIINSESGQQSNENNDNKVNNDDTIENNKDSVINDKDNVINNDDSVINGEDNEINDEDSVKTNKGKVVDDINVKIKLNYETKENAYGKNIKNDNYDVTYDKCDKNNEKLENIFDIPLNNKTESGKFKINIHESTGLADKLKSDINKTKVAIIYLKRIEININNESQMSINAKNNDNVNDVKSKQYDQKISENDKDNETPSNDEMDTQNGDELENNSDLIDEDLKFEVKLEKRYLKAYENNRDFFERKKLFDKPLTGLQCLICHTKAYRTPQQLYKHINTHITEADKKYICSICYTLFDSNNALVNHKSTHENDEIYFCLQCKLAFSEHIDWQLHKTTHEDNRLHKCKECYKFFVLKSVYQAHLKIHYEEKIACAECGVKFRTETSYKSHMDVHSKTFECCECGKLCNNDSTLKYHLYTHIGYRPYQCHYCGLGYLTKGTRDSHHQRVHVTTDKLFRCKSCGKSVKTAHSLRKHIRESHIDTKVKCNICDKKIQKRNLTLHMLTHEDANYCCQFCPRKFTQSNSLKMHIIYKHTESKPFPCDLCSKAFKTATCLKLHRRRHANYKNIDRGVFEMK